MYAVIFTSTLSEDTDGYAEASRRMLELCAAQPGFVSANSVRDDQGRGVTVCMWESLEAIKAWGRHPEHQKAQREGATRWYSEYDTAVCEVVTQTQV